MTREELKSALVTQQGWSKDQADLGIQAGFRCEYCGRDLLASIENYDAWQRDHILPISKGGAKAATNLALSCKTCNFMKRNWTPKERMDPAADRSGCIALVRALIRERREIKQSELERVRALVKQLVVSQPSGQG